MFTLCQTRAQVVLIPLAKTLYNHSLYNIRHKDSMFQGFFFSFPLSSLHVYPYFGVKILVSEGFRTVNCKHEASDS